MISLADFNLLVSELLPSLSEREFVRFFVEFGLGSEAELWQLVQLWQLENGLLQTPVLAEPVASPLPELLSQLTQPSSPVPPTAGLYQGDILSLLSQTTLHILLACMSGAGKSTTLRVLIFLILHRNPQAQFFIADPKTTDWLGLQRFPGVVTYLNGNETEQLLDLAAVVGRVFQILEQRIAAVQRALQRGESRQDYHDVYLLIDEWFSLYDALSRIDSKTKRELGLDAVVGWINTIIAKGRELKVHLFLVSQTHLSGETGISTAMRKSMAIIAQGFISPSGDGGYASIEGVIGDANVFRSQSQREALFHLLYDQAVPQSERLSQPILLTTMGVPKIALLPNLAGIENLKIERYGYAEKSSLFPNQPFNQPLPAPAGSNPDPEPLNQASYHASNPPETASSTFTQERLSRSAAIQRINELKDAGMNQTQIILSLWGAKKGGSKAYQQAICEYKDLMAEA